MAPNQRQLAPQRPAGLGGPKQDRRADPTLVARCLEGDERAWATMIDRYSRLVYSIPRRYGLPEADAEDIHQRVFLALFRHLSSLRQHDRLSAWLITTAHRECWRVGKRGEFAAEIEQVIEDVGSPSDDDLERWEQQHIVRSALEQLGGRCEDLLTALFLGGDTPSYPAIAEALGIKVGSIGPTRARCFDKLRPILAELGLSESGMSQNPEETGIRSSGRISTEGRTRMETDDDA